MKLYKVLCIYFVAFVIVIFFGTAVRLYEIHNITEYQKGGGKEYSYYDAMKDVVPYIKYFFVGD